MQDLDSQLFGESVRDELLCGQKATPERTARADEVLDALGLGALADRHPATLSGGQKQRLALGVALMHDASVIVLDEPTTYLDIRACHETMELVRRLNEEAGKTIVMVIHDLDLALRYSDRLLVMERGRASAAGTVEEVLATGAIERAFGVSIRPHEAAEGRAYTLFPA